jgi:hypothetical protein
MTLHPTVPRAEYAANIRVCPVRRNIGAEIGE